MKDVAGDIFADAKVVGEIRLTAGRVVRVRTLLVHGRPRVDVRLFVPGEERDETVPTRKGLVLPAEKLDDFMTLLGQVPAPAVPKSAGKGRAPG
jgi:hypothetical protein